MNKENAKDYLPLVQALAEGKTIQEYGLGYELGEWKDHKDVVFHYEPSRYRIKPEPKKGWYRVALFPKGTVSADCDAEESRLEKTKFFVRWLTDRIEYELPEGDA